MNYNKLIISDISTLSLSNRNCNQFYIINVSNMETLNILKRKLYDLLISANNINIEMEEYKYTIILSSTEEYSNECDTFIIKYNDYRKRIKDSELSYKRKQIYDDYVKFKPNEFIHIGVSVNPDDVLAIEVKFTKDYFKDIANESEIDNPYIYKYMNDIELIHIESK